MLIITTKRIYAAAFVHCDVFHATYNQCTKIQTFPLPLLPLKPIENYNFLKQLFDIFKSPPKHHTKITIATLFLTAKYC